MVNSNFLPLGLAIFGFKSMRTCHFAVKNVVMSRNCVGRAFKGPCDMWDRMSQKWTSVFGPCSGENHHIMTGSRLLICLKGVAKHHLELRLKKWLSPPRKRYLLFI